MNKGWPCGVHQEYRAGVLPLCTKGGPRLRCTGATKRPPVPPCTDCVSWRGVQDWLYVPQDSMYMLKQLKVRPFFFFFSTVCPSFSFHDKGYSNDGITPVIQVTCSKVRKHRWATTTTNHILKSQYPVKKPQFKTLVCRLVDLSYANRYRISLENSKYRLELEGRVLAEMSLKKIVTDEFPNVVNCTEKEFIVLTLLERIGTR